MLKVLCCRKPIPVSYTPLCCTEPSILTPQQHSFLGHVSLMVERSVQGDELQPVFDSYVYARRLQDSVARSDASMGKGFHCHLVKTGIELDLFAWNILLHLYAKLCAVSDARQLFDEMPERNTVSFVSLIQGYSASKNFTEATNLFLRLHREGHELNAFVFTTILKLFVNMELPTVGQPMHTCAYKLGCSSSAFVGSSLIETYSMCGHVDLAKKIFDGILEKDVISWTGMIAGYTENDSWEEAVTLFIDMRHEGFAPNSFILTCLLKACSCLESFSLGIWVHGLVIKHKYELDAYVAGYLQNMYARCGDVENSRAIFEGMTCRNVIIWSSMISLYAQSGHGEEALNLFVRMNQAFIIPNDYTYSSVLQATAYLEDLERGMQIHSHLVKVGAVLDIYASNALIDVYAKCGRIADSMQLFVELDHKTEVTWNTVIVGHVKSGNPEGAVILFCQMLDAQIMPSLVTYSCVLRASAISAALEQGTQIHALVTKTPFREGIVVTNALIDMYAKCGLIKSARKVFDGMNEYDQVSWNSVISGHSFHGLSQETLNLFKVMTHLGIDPNGITFVCVLSACGYLGLVDEGCFYFDSMIKDYGIEPSMEHYSCMVRLLGRSGQLDEAMNYIEAMPSEPSVMVWRSLLGACIVHNNTELGKVVAQKIIGMDPEDGSTYILLSNMYAASGHWNNVAAVRNSMKRRGIKKEPGLSWIEIMSEIYAFKAGDEDHPEIRVIHGILEWLNIKARRVGYTPDTTVVLHDEDEHTKECLLWVHSERLALAFALLKLPIQSPIRIIKNLRICTDCHTAFKVISEVVSREILVRDLHRFHCFEGGFCSCKDYW